MENPFKYNNYYIDDKRIEANIYVYVIIRLLSI